jgi:hypothetical protein
MIVEQSKYHDYACGQQHRNDLADAMENRRLGGRHCVVGFHRREGHSMVDAAVDVYLSMVEAVHGIVCLDSLTTCSSEGRYDRTAFLLEERATFGAIKAAHFQSLHWDG